MPSAVIPTFRAPPTWAPGTCCPAICGSRGAPDIAASLSDRRNTQTAAAELDELLVQHAQVHGESAEGLLRRAGNEGERFRLPLSAEDWETDNHSWGYIFDRDVRRTDGRSDLLRHEPGRERSQHPEDARGARQAEVADRRRVFRDRNRRLSGRRSNWPRSTIRRPTIRPASQPKSSCCRRPASRRRTARSSIRRAGRSGRTRRSIRRARQSAIRRSSRVSS